MQNKRRQVEDREQFTEEERSRIVKKSSERCAWCGKKVYFGYGATVDHYVPLKKGGTNDFENLVLMCKDCNEAKGSKIVPPSVGAHYLNEEYRNELDTYFDNYIQSFDYTSRGNLLCCDMYEIAVIPEVVSTIRTKSQRNKVVRKLNTVQSRYILKRAYPDDEEKLVDYYSKYLAKYNLLESREAAQKNIKFWLRFGAIYYIDRNNEICVMTSIVVNKHDHLVLNLFPYYSNGLAYTLARGIISSIGDAVVNENNIPYLPLSVVMVKSDELTPRILHHDHCDVIDERLCAEAYYISNDSYQLDSSPESLKILIESHKRVKSFMKQFYDIENDIRLYLYDNDMLDYDWLAEEILSDNEMLDGSKIRLTDGAILDFDTGEVDRITHE